MAQRKKKKKLSDEQTDELVSDWIAAIGDLREFFFECSPDELGDVFYDRFLEKFQNVEQLFHIMIEQDMFVHESEHRETEEDIINSIEPKQIKGQRNDN